VPLASPTAWTRVSGRLVIALCALALLMTGVFIAAEPTAASSVDARMAAVRAAQKSAESEMRGQDQAILRLKAQRKAANKLLQQEDRELKSLRSALALVKRVSAERHSRYARVAAEYPNPENAPLPDIYRARLQNIRKEIRVADSRKAIITRNERAQTRVVHGKKSTVANLTRQRKLASSRRRSAEASLSAYIYQMRALAGQKANEQSTGSITSGASLSWPTTGRIVQTYGCTGFRLNARRGSCAHFHDGIDVVSGYGTPVRSVAPGVVAYAGWNPYDKEGRAYVVDIMHAGGFMSRYGHLIGSGPARAGQVVHTGQVIGKMGSTGKSTGTHLHFELLSGKKTVNPLTYLPQGVVLVDKASTKTGKDEKVKRTRQADKRAAELARKQAAEQAAKRAAALRALEKAEAKKAKAKAERVTKDARAAAAACRPSEADDGTDADTGDASHCDPAAVLSFASAEGDGPPGFPLPYRESSPAPA
jgi:murein DD-endopeptidase MepM/ murein hydrolase activator NlpD